MTTFFKIGAFDDLTNWLKDAFTKILKDIFEFFTDLMLEFLDMCLDLVVEIFNAIPVPSFINEHSLAEYVTQLPDSVLFFIGIFRLDEALGFISVALTFRMIRKLVTLGMW